jgi:hypothetical protein
VLNENDVVRHVCAHLERKGFKIESACTTADVGVDVIAQRGEERLLVEAKSAASAKEKSARFGKPFDSNQVRDHVANAVYTALLLNEASSRQDRVVLALPNDTAHRLRLGKVEGTLSRLGIRVYWVSDDGSISETE